MVFLLSKLYIVKHYTADAGNTTTSQSAVPTNVATKVVQVVQSTTVPTPKPTLAPTATPTPKPSPTESASQTEAGYKNSTTSTTVANLDKDGSADQGNDVHFTCKILKFVKDSTGTTVGANVTTLDYSSISVIQVTFTSGTDLSQLNENVILEVWGNDQGEFSGTNAYGGTIQEVSITAQYMSDQTTNYQANS